MERVYDTNHLIGKMIDYNNDKYLISKLIGNGGVSEVYIVFNVNDANKKLCIKVFNPRMEFKNNLDNLRDRFQHEFVSGKNFKHKKIVNIYGFGKIEEHIYYFMEYCEFGNLKSLLRESEGRNRYSGKLSLYEKLNIFIQICDGLFHIHKTGIHRDIKPDNILVSSKEYDNRNAIVKIGDYGTYYDLTNLTDNPYTSKSDKFGSLVYISPEQKKGEQLDLRTDIYSLGIILNQMLSENINDYRLNKKVVGFQVSSEVVSALKRIVTKMCEENLLFRYQSISDVLIDLKKQVTDKLKDTFDKTKIEYPSWISFEEKIDIYNDSKSSFLINDRKPYLLNLHDNAWEYQFDGPEEFHDDLIPTESIVYSEIVITGWGNGYITCLNLDDGHVIWSRKISENSFRSTPAIYKRKAYFISDIGELFVINIFDGEVVYTQNFDIKCTCPLKFQEYNLVVVSNNGIIILYNTETKKIVNQINFDSYMEKDNHEIHTIHQVGKGILVYYNYGIKYFDNLETGNYMTWWFYCEQATWSEYQFTDTVVRGIVHDNQNVYFSTNEGLLGSLDIVNGSLNWQIETAEGVSIPFLDKDYLCFVSEGGYLHNVEKSTGAVIKKRKVDMNSYRNSDPKSYGLTIPFKNEYLVFEENAVVAHNKNTYKNEERIVIFDYYYNYTDEFHNELRIPSMTSDYLIISYPNNIIAMRLSLDNDESKNEFIYKQI